MPRPSLFEPSAPCGLREEIRRPKSALMRNITHFIDGAAIAGTSGLYGDVFNPNTSEGQALVALATKAEVDNAGASAVRAQQTSLLVNPQRRSPAIFHLTRRFSRDLPRIAQPL